MERCIFEKSRADASERKMTVNRNAISLVKMYLCIYFICMKHAFLCSNSGVISSDIKAMAILRERSVHSRIILMDNS